MMEREGFNGREWLVGQEIVNGLVRTEKNWMKR